MSPGELVRLRGDRAHPVPMRGRASDGSFRYLPDGEAWHMDPGDVGMVLEGKGILVRVLSTERGREGWLPVWFVEAVHGEG